MASITATPNKLFIENYKILQKGKEHNTTLSHNYHSVDLVTGKLEEPSQPNLLIGFSLDHSGSMAGSFTSTKNHTPLQHCLHTVNNIVDYLGDMHDDNPNLNISVTLNAFDNQIKNCGHYNVGDDIEEAKFLAKINKLKPRGGTNISGAFESLKNLPIYSQTSDSQKAHILLTDGQPNEGKTSAEGITEQNPGGKQFYIGYGIDHDANLLQKMAELTNGTYSFVESFENAGMVYGEIIHSLLYDAVKNITVTVKGAEVYDFTKNEWTSKIKFNNFASEHTQSLILRSSWNSVELVTVNIIYTETGNGVIHSKTDNFNCYNCTNGESKQSNRDVDVEKQMFRQRALEGLFHAKNADYESKNSLKTQLIELEKEMKEFMDAKNLTDDAFMQKLLGDVYVAYTGMDCYGAGNAFIAARLVTQGNQMAYDVNNVDVLDRQNAVDLGDELFGGHTLSAASSFPRQSSAPVSAGEICTTIRMPKPGMLRQSSCYTTPTQATVMRACSQPISPPISDTEEITEE